MRQLHILLLTFAISFAGSAYAQVPAPTPDAEHPNLFYGAQNPGVNFETPVLVFVPGFGGTAFHWFSDNDMYEKCFIFGYRTAFISPEPDNSPAAGSIEHNADQIKLLVPKIAAHYNTDELYFVGHSKGGVDFQAAMLDPNIRSLVKGLFTISTPNQGTELADWAFLPENEALATSLNLRSDAVSDMRTANMAAFRANVDGVLGPPKNMYTIAGNQFVNNVLTLVTGTILRGLVPGIEHEKANDGLVTVGNTLLDPNYANNLGIVPANHLDTDSGNRTFPKISARIQANESSYLDEFERIAVNGFEQLGGDDSNTWVWSAKWFKGKLYVGTAREAFCVSLLTSDVRTGTEIYGYSYLSGQCPGEIELAQSLGAEIWQYTPETETWLKVYQSPNTIPMTVNGVDVMVARDAGFRGMAVHTEPDGTVALYAGGVTAGSVYDPDNTQPGDYPGPSLMRSVDGVNWAPVPEEPGTFIGELGNFFITPNTKIRSYRSLTSYKGKLFATIGSYVGSGTIIASDDPAAGNDAWQTVSPPYEEMAVWTLYVYNDHLYATTGFTRAQNPEADGYALFKTDAEGDVPYTFTPVITSGGFQTDPNFVAPNGLSFTEFRGELYLGTNRPTELVRVRPDDSWDLIVGEPRNTPDGMKYPLSGFGNGFGNWFNGHFWRMAQHETNMYLGTWDWSVGLQGFSLVDPLDKLFAHNYGFDFFRTPDAIHFTAITQSGLGDPNNSGIRSLESTPFGLFAGSARQRYGFEIFQRTGDGNEGPLPPPMFLRSEPGSLGVGSNVELNWLPSPGAVSYNVYRSTARPLEELVALIFPMLVTNPQGETVEITQNDAENGALDFLCEGASEDIEPCQLLDMAVDPEPQLIPASFPLAYTLVGQTNGTTFSEPAPTRLQSIYYVRAVDANGKLSKPSNLAGGPSRGPDVEYNACDIDFDGDVDRNDLAQITDANREPALGPDDPRDVNHDGVISTLDSRVCVRQCDNRGCGL